jgi:hypothetical protein
MASSISGGILTEIIEELVVSFLDFVFATRSG